MRPLTLFPLIMLLALGAGCPTPASDDDDSASGDDDDATGDDDDATGDDDDATGDDDDATGDDDDATGDDDDATGDDDDATGDDDDDTGTPVVSFEEVFSLMTVECDDCHTTDDDGRLTGFSTRDGMYDAIVNVPSDDLPGMNLVEPGSSSDSYLYHKVAGTHEGIGGDGRRMPRVMGGSGLTEAQIGLIRDWIEGGAER